MSSSHVNTGVLASDCMECAETETNGGLWEVSGFSPLSLAHKREW